MKNHLKRIVAPRTIRIARKEDTWMIRPSAGAHPLKNSIPLGNIVRDYLGLCDSYREVKRVISNGSVLVDGRPRKSHQYPCGFMDVVSIPATKKDYRIVYDRKGRLELVPITGKEASWKLCRIENKTHIKGGLTQLNFHDGRTKLVDNDEYKTGDVVRLNLSDSKIEETYPFTKGSISLIIGGSHVGETAEIVHLQTVSSSRANLATMKGAEEFFTITHYVFPIGKAKPVISLPEVSMNG